MCVYFVSLGYLGDTICCRPGRPMRIDLDDTLFTKATVSTGIRRITFSRAEFYFIAPLHLVEFQVYVFEKYRDKIIPSTRGSVFAETRVHTYARVHAFTEAGART